MIIPTNDFFLIQKRFIIDSNRAQVQFIGVIFKAQKISCHMAISTINKTSLSLVFILI